jgi:hypothetical protein
LLAAEVLVEAVEERIEIVGVPRRLHSLHDLPGITLHGRGAYRVAGELQHLLTHSQAEEVRTAVPGIGTGGPLNPKKSILLSEIVERTGVAPSAFVTSPPT